MKVERNEDLRTISILQEAFINKALMAADMQDCKEVNTSMIGSLNFLKNPEPATDEELVRVYQSHIRIQI